MYKNFIRIEIFSIKKKENLLVPSVIPYDLIKPKNYEKNVCYVGPLLTRARKLARTYVEPMQIGICRVDSIVDRRRTPVIRVQVLTIIGCAYN